MKNLKIISGGQTGADIAGLKAAKALGFETGGLMPVGFMTEDGPRPEYQELYGVEEANIPSYAYRTEQNVYKSSMTFVFSDNLKSRGTVLTIEKCIFNLRPYWINPDTRTIRKILRIRSKMPTTINIAGNRESVAPGIEQRVYNLLMEAFGNG